MPEITLEKAAELMLEICIEENDTLTGEACRRIKAEEFQVGFPDEHKKAVSVLEFYKTICMEKFREKVKKL